MRRTDEYDYRSIILRSKGLEYLFIGCFLSVRTALPRGHAKVDRSYGRADSMRRVRERIEATFQAKNRYRRKDGVTWVRVSPGGKIGNIRGKFAQFQTNPPPARTMFHDNTMQHLFRRKFFGSTVRVEAPGVTGDGKSPVSLNTFQRRAEGSLLAGVTP
jgi:hypothetical protein